MGDTTISTQVSFKVPFYSCMSCEPNQVDGTFNKRNSNWYDDDYISTYGMKQASNGNQDDGNQGDDKYMSSNDDIGNYDDGKYNNRRILTASDLAPEVCTQLDALLSAMSVCYSTASQYDSFRSYCTELRGKLLGRIQSDSGRAKALRQLL
jgi:hypothetical protein